MCDVGANRIRPTSIANPIKNQATVLKRVVAFVLFKKNCGDVSGNVSAASILSVRVYSYFMYFCRRKVVKDFLQNPERETGENPVQNPLL